MVGGRDLTKLVKLHTPTLDRPVPIMGAGLEGVGDITSEISVRLPEFTSPLKYLAVGAAWTAGDLVGRQFFESTKEDGTKKGYYGARFLFSIPALALGRMIADFIGGSPMVKALVIGTVANVALQGYFILADFEEFNLTSFLLHESLLVPLSLLVAQEGDAILKKNA